ncbi:MAG: acyl-CoA dehydrogenase family protein [Dehalococcoidales bacterium]
MDFELSEELKMIQSLVRDFVEQQLKPLERDILGRAADLSNAREYLPPEKETALIKMVKEMGLWGIGVPVELGGAGLSALGVCLVEEELANTIVPFRFGDVTPILFDCNAEQRKKYLSPALNNEKQPYLALIEDENGGLADIKTKAIKSDGHFIIDGKKLSFSRQSDDFFAVVFAQTEKGMTCFIVDKGTLGFSVNKNSGERTGWLTQVRVPLSLGFKDCRVSPENILGQEGKAFTLGGKWLPQRRIVRGARCVGIARRLLEEAAARAQSTESFGQPIYRRTSAQEALADMAVNVHAARLMVYEAACKADAGKPIFQESAMIKLYTSRMLQLVTGQVAHIFNGPANTDGLVIERLCHNAKQATLAEMTLQRQRGIITGDLLKGLKV